MSNQFACIGLHRPKNAINIGSALRAAHCFDASLVAVSGTRFKRSSTDVFDTWKTIPLLRVEELRTAVPFDCVPVAVDLVEGAQSLESYRHPARAFYVFGAEDGTLGQRTLSWCRDRVSIPAGCLNLAMSVNIVLYDRKAKLLRNGLEEVPGESVRQLKMVGGANG